MVLKQNNVKQEDKGVSMTLRELQNEIQELIDDYGEDCPVKSFIRLGNVTNAPSIWYDEDEDSVLIH